jgi:hypothetical protein
VCVFCCRFFLLTKCVAFFFFVSYLFFFPSTISKSGLMTYTFLNLLFVSKVKSCALWLVRILLKNLLKYCLLLCSLKLVGLLVVINAWVGGLKLFMGMRIMVGWPGFFDLKVNGKKY